MKIWITAAAAAALLTAVFAGTASANHSWSTYHWARTANPFTVGVIDSNSPSWDGHLNAAVADWNTSTVLDVALEGGNEEKRCRAVAGKVKSCNGNYGQNG